MNAKPMATRRPVRQQCRDCCGDGLSPYGRWLHEYGALVTEVDDRTVAGADVPEVLLTALAIQRDARPDPEPCPCGTALACPACHGTGRRPDHIVATPPHTNQEEAVDPTCDHCGEPLSAHCPDCTICDPDDVEHPDWCPVQKRRDKNRLFD